MFAGLGVVTSVGAAFHVFTHAFFKALLFLACGAVMHGFAGQLDLRKLSGVQKMPGWRIVGFTMLVGCLNLAGFPFMAGFWSKDMILAQCFTTPGYGLVGWVLLITAGLTAYYTFRVYFRVFLGPVEYHAGEDHHADHATHEELAGHTSGHEPVRAGHTPEPHHEQVAEERALAEQERVEGGSHDFHPHAPGWAINLVLATLAALAMLAIGVNFIGPHRGEGGWVAGMIEHSSAAWPAPGAHHASLAGVAEGAAEVHSAAEAVAHGGEAPHAAAGTFLGMNPHAVMYYVSAVVGILGILIAWWLHLAGRTTAATARADKLLPALGPIPRWAQHKWYVDELYDYLFRLPLLTLSHIFALIDKLLVDGLVNLFGWLPRGLGKSLRPSQSGELHGYAAAMAGGIGFILLIVLLVTM
jgi:NADH-quinone oxidoreductase subunit L